MDVGDKIPAGATTFCQQSYVPTLPTYTLPSFPQPGCSSEAVQCLNCILHEHVVQCLLSDRADAEQL